MTYDLKTVFKSIIKSLKIDTVILLSSVYISDLPYLSKIMVLKTMLSLSVAE